MSGRPHSPGLKYFPVDVDIFRNSKILDLKEDYRSEGLLFYMQLLATIYSKGNYIVWERSNIRDFRQAYEYTDAQIKMFVDAIVNIDLLSKTLFEKYNILTSDAIQERYLYSTKKRERIYYVKEYLLIKFENYRSIPQPVCIVDINGEVIETIIKEPDQKYNKNKGKTEPLPVVIKKEPIKPKTIIPDDFELLTPAHHRDLQLENTAAQFFNYNEIKHRPMVTLFGHFVHALYNRGELENFKEQFNDYIEYKTKSNTTIHNFNNFIGSQSEAFSNGIWNTESWRAKLEDFLLKSQAKNGHAKTVESKAEQAISGHENFVKQFKQHE